MMFEMATQADMMNLESNEFHRAAVYFESMDYVDYVRRDDVSVSQRIDKYLTLVWDKDRSELIGFRLKGIRNFFLRELKPYLELSDEDFIHVRDLFILLTSEIGEEIFTEQNRHEAYRKAMEMASNDNVSVALPKAA